MISAWFHGEESYLGQPLHGACPKVFIVGTDQPESDWHTLFQREGLVDRDGNMAGPIEMLWHTGAPLHLTEGGIAHLGEIAAANPGALFLLDSYHACCAPLGLEEALAPYSQLAMPPHQQDGPARQLAEALSDTHRVVLKTQGSCEGTTLAMIHHTNKSVSGGNATNASRGSNAADNDPHTNKATASLTILMNWFKQPAEGKTQSDHRVVLKTQGRAKGTTLLIELQDDGWLLHGDGESVMAAEAIQEASDELQGRQADIFDHMCDRWAAGEFPVTTAELQDVAKCNASKVNRALRSLEKKSLVRQEGQLEGLSLGGRPQLLWVPNTPSLESGEKRGTRETTPRARIKRRGYSPFSPGSPTSPDPLLRVFLIREPLFELHRNGAWNNGWVVLDASNADSVKAAKLGNSNVTVGNLRWDLDVRLCPIQPF